MKILRFVKKIFFIGLTILSDFINASSSLNCISMKNQECKTRLQVVNVNSNNPKFYSFSIKISKSNGNCNNINNPYGQFHRNRITFREIFFNLHSIAEHILTENLLIIEILLQVIKLVQFQENI